ncbi:hypothetical protein IIE18_10255 [Pseudomonas sp. V1]|uniref:hypothetical protein n=1 Tax=Pseudomonas arcuscaelestis TaxID=2710591 RepID=UPI00193F8345|nr:hypothetical protein [Pseudomonas arcuscaelestis]MBM3105521.1 hypothetical protein [Pseudomonas arcuscaelestis]
MLQLTSNEAAQALKMQRPDQPNTIQLGYKGHTFDVILAPGQPPVAPVDFTPWLLENEDAASNTHGEWWEHHVEVRLLAPNPKGSQSLIPVSKACTGMVPSFLTSSPA